MGRFQNGRQLQALVGVLEVAATGQERMGFLAVGAQTQHLLGWHPGHAHGALDAILSADMLDLALFAYCVRCLLEYRVSGHESWLLRAAIVYALGMTDTWVMMALAPVKVC